MYTRKSGMKEIVLPIPVGMCYLSITFMKFASFVYQSQQTDIGGP
jgi:hypothetical protein